MANKSKIMDYDWKENIENVFEDIIPFLKQFGLYVFINPLSIGTDSYGYVFTNNKNITIGDYRKLMRKKYSDIDEIIDGWNKEYKLTDKNLLSVLIKKAS